MPACAAQAADAGAYQEQYKYDAAQPLEVKVAQSKPGLFANEELGTLRGVRGNSVPYILAMPRTASADHKAPLVLLWHGVTQTINDFEPIALYLAAQGYACVLPEIVDHGARRTGANPSLHGLDVKRTHDGIIESVGDARRTLDYVLTRPDIDGQRIGLVGMSLGAIMGSILTAIDPRVKTAVLLVGGADWKLLKPNDYPADPAQAALLEPVDPKNFAGRIAPRPVLLINARQDEFIPRPASDALFAATGEPKKQVWLDGGHVLSPMLVVPPVKQWLQATLMPAR